MKTLMMMVVLTWGSNALAGRGLTGNNGWSCVVDGVAYACGSQAKCPLGNDIGKPCEAHGKPGKTQRGNSLKHGSSH